MFDLRHLWYGQTEQTDTFQGTGGSSKCNNTLHTTLCLNQCCGIILGLFFFCCCIVTVRWKMTIVRLDHGHRSLEKLCHKCLIHRNCCRVAYTAAAEISGTGTVSKKKKKKKNSRWNQCHCHLELKSKSISEPTEVVVMYNKECSIEIPDKEKYIFSISFCFGLL